MSIDTVSFTPFTSLAGGALIGLAAGWFVLARGRIAGISSLMGQLLPERGERGIGFATGRSVAALFLAGLIVVPLLFRIAGWQGAPRISGSLPLLVLAGLAVGFGTRLGNGCTSGHGVCGISRLSPRSIIATGLFMASAMATVWLQKMLS